MDAYTDLKQSIELAKLIDNNTADFCWGVNQRIKEKNKYYYNRYPYPIPWKEYIKMIHAEGLPNKPCWSLAALMDILPASINVGNDLCTLKIHKNHNNKDLKNLKAVYDICYLDKNNNGVGFFKMNLLEAVIEMINYLVENKLI